jgi:hypothetical protein
MYSMSEKTERLKIKMANDVATVANGLTDVFTGKNEKVVLDGYETIVVAECQNEGCNNEFPSPVIILADIESQEEGNLVCSSCADSIE